MKLFLAAILVAGLSFCSPKSHGQVNFGTPSQQFTYTPVNGGTGGLVGVVIPNSNGLTVNVATGSAALPLQNIAGAPGAQQLYLGDDSSQQVPIGFTFPYWGQNFTNSWMYSNGIVSFTTGGIPGAGCCGGQDLSAIANQGTRNNVYNYMIAPLWTDLIDINNNATWVLKNSNSVTYGWYNTHEYYNNNTSSFEVNINSSGAFDVRYGSAFVSTGHAVTSGFTGDLSKGQYFQYYHGNGFNVPTANPVSYGTTAVAGTPVDPCIANPLSSPSCSGYQAAYTIQQCTINALFDPSCPGYAAVHQTQQCTINPLYNSGCPGFAQAYHDQQCSVNPLYATDCPGYAASYLSQQCSLNPLYSTTCQGYQQAYFNQQCSLNPLYNSSCPGYSTAYHNQQCSINPLFATDCTGYQQAYHDQQCSINPLFASDCPGYQQAYQTYQFNRACQANPQSSPTCPGYVTPVVASTTTSTNSSTQTATTTPVASTTTQTVTPAQTTAVTTTLSTTAPPTTVSVSTSGTLTSPTTVAIVADPVVNNVITNNNTSTASPASSPAAPTSAATTPAPTSSPSSPTASATTAAASPTPAPTPTPTPAPTRASMSAPKPTKEQVATAGNNAMKDSDNAGSMEQQKSVQNVVIGAMGYVQGFDAYNVTMKDVAFYKPYSVYGNQKTIDNRFASRGLFGATDKIHEEMVQQQYQLGK
jgi:hypothetical protein